MPQRLALAALLSLALLACTVAVIKEPGTDAAVTTDGSLGADARPPGDAATDATGASPCTGVTCSGLGTCEVADGGVPTCACAAGNHPEGLDCVADETCTGLDCGRCGACEVLAGIATCTCPEGMSHDGTGCVPDPDPCSPDPCGVDEHCVPEAHCQPLGACVPTCDCSNCPNCAGDNSDGRWNDWQEYCGNLNASPATLTCNRPCPPGDGCLPYSIQFCWPMEGCFSL